MLLLTLIASSLAADSFDAHGFRLGAFDDNPTAPLQLVLPHEWERGAFHAGAVLEYADSPLVLVHSDGTVEKLLDDIVAANLVLGYAPHERLRLTAGAPLFFASTGPLDQANGLGLGDLRVTADAVLLQGPVSLGLAPFVDLPSGAEAANLGQSGVAGGALLGARAEAGRASIGLNVGPYFQPSIELGNLQGVDRLLAGAHLGYGVTDSLGLNLESRLELPFGANDVAGTDMPAELLLFGHKRFDSGAHLMLGGAGAVSPGAGAALFRLFVGGGFGRFAEPAPEIVEEPPPEAGLTIEVLLEGKRVVDAPVLVAGTMPLEVMSAARPIEHLGLAPGEIYTATATHGPCMEGAGEAVVPEQGLGALQVVLTPKRDAVVRLEIYDADDKPLLGGIVSWEREVTHCVPGEPLVLKETHQGRQSIGVGTHTVFVTVEGYNTYVETVELAEGDDELIVVKLAPTKVAVSEEKIEILDKVYFEYDGDQIDPKSGALLDEVAAILRAHPEIAKVEVGGHTDAHGEDDYNLDLSQRRVDRVRSWLIDKGVAAERLVAKGYGEGSPIDTNDTPAGRARNRRVEFTILERTASEASTGTIIRTVDTASDEQKQDAGHDEDNRPEASKIDTE
jgi:outer membrane protein OmpA-like peptidoglycan-associated protein